MQKILLITPQRNLRKPKEQYLSMPMGLASLASFLQVNGYIVEIIDTPIEGFNTRELINGVYKCGMSNEKLKEAINDFKPDIVGISCHFTARYNNVVGISRLVKEISKDLPVVVGGMHASVCAEKVIQEPSIDFITLGEGEIPFLNLLNKLKNKETDFEKIAALAHKKDGKYFISNERVLVECLDTLPIPAYELLPLEKYFKLCPGRDGMTSERRYASVITSRGCPHSCSFCSSKNLWSNKWRPRSPMHILYELETLWNVYKIKEISFEDDNLTLDIGRVQALCREMIHRNLQFKWNTPNGVSVLNLDKDTIRLMKQSGCTRLNFGIESGDDEILKVMNKTIPLKKTQEVIKIAHDEGLTTTGYFVIGMPGETIQSMQRSLDFAKSLPLDEIGLNIAVPYPSTWLEQETKTKGWLKIDAADIIAEDDIGQMAFFETPYLTTKDLMEFKKYFFYDFYRSRIINNPLPYMKRAIKHPILIRRFLWRKS